jgi:hypothetical protein
MVKDIIALVVADLQETFPTLTSKIGAAHLADADSPPRLVWVRSTDTHGPPLNQCLEPRQLWTEKPQLLVHVWGAPDDPNDDDGSATEALADALKVSLYNVLAGEVQLGSGLWPSEDGSVGNLSSLYVLPVTFEKPINDAALAEVIVTTINTSPQLEEP